MERVGAVAQPFGARIPDRGGAVHREHRSLEGIAGVAAERGPFLPGADGPGKLEVHQHVTRVVVYLSFHRQRIAVRAVAFGEVDPVDVVEPAYREIGLNVEDGRSQHVVGTVGVPAGDAGHGLGIAGDGQSGRDYCRKRVL